MTTTKTRVRSASKTRTKSTTKVGTTDLKAGLADYGKHTGINAGIGAAEGIIRECATYKGDLAGSAGRVAKTAAYAGARSVGIKAVEQQLEKRVAGAIFKETAKVGLKEAGKQGVKQAARSALRGNAVTNTAFLVVDQAVDTYRLARGEIKSGEYGCRTCENVASAGGGVGGAMAGAALGTAIFPGVGTVVGGIVGGMAGSFGGLFAAKKALR